MQPSHFGTASISGESDSGVVIRAKKWNGQRRASSFNCEADVPREASSFPTYNSHSGRNGLQRRASVFARRMSVATVKLSAPAFYLLSSFPCQIGSTRLLAHVTSRKEEGDRVVIGIAQWRSIKTKCRVFHKGPLKLGFAEESSLSPWHAPRVASKPQACVRRIMRILNVRLCHFGYACPFRFGPADVICPDTA